jgi:TusA-related sulfurtransferase
MRRTLDLRGIRCPLSWAKARVTLETLERSEELELPVDDPQAARDIPRAPERRGITWPATTRGHRDRRACCDRFEISALPS